MFGVVWRPLFERSIAMPENRTANPDLNRAFSDAKKQAGDVASEVQDAAADLYGQARDSAAQVADATTTAARKTAGSFERALRNTIETQRRWSSRSASAGCSVACTDHSKNSAQPRSARQPTPSRR